MTRQITNLKLSKKSFGAFETEMGHKINSIPNVDMDKLTIETELNAMECDLVDLTIENETQPL